MHLLKQGRGGTRGATLRDISPSKENSGGSRLARVLLMKAHYSYDPFSPASPRVQLDPSSILIGQG